ncbi:hypothetical protein ANO14919_034650 [Xylariales sp. No.14919]|nr:hypothetical protein ANO14919_034650 [Xylariales sp. No.14919]
MDGNSPLTPDSIPLAASSRPRRAHHKSRLGCKTCKSRKIKCDERKPVCGNCAKHNVACDFTVPEEQAPPTSIRSPVDLNLDHLELLHNYTTSTYATLSESPALRDFYRITAVQVGLKCDYVMRALLAISSLQLAYYRPHMREHYQSVAMHHHQIASRVAINLMQDVNPSTAENLFLFSVLTIFYAFGCPRRDSHLLLVGEGGIPSWLLLHQGTRALTELAIAQGDGPLAPLFKHGVDRWCAREIERQTTSSAHRHLDRLQALIEHDEPDEGHRNAYIKAITQLHKSFLAMDCEVGRAYDVTDVFVWVYEVAEDFLPLLRAQTQNAVTILAFFCVLFKGLKGQWWLHGWADHLIAKSYALLDREHRLLIQWPMEEVGYVP